MLAKLKMKNCECIVADPLLLTLTLVGNIQKITALNAGSPRVILTPPYTLLTLYHFFFADLEMRALFMRNINIS